MSNGNAEGKIAYKVDFLGSVITVKEIDSRYRQITIRFPWGTEEKGYMMHFRQDEQLALRHAMTEVEERTEARKKREEDPELFSFWIK